MEPTTDQLRQIAFLQEAVRRSRQRRQRLRRQRQIGVAKLTVMMLAPIAFALVVRSVLRR